MKFVVFILLLTASIFVSTGVFATGTTAPVLGTTDNILGVENEDLRAGNVSMDTIPQVIVSVIEFLIGIAGTIAIVGLIYNAVQMQLHSGIMGDTSGVDKAKK